MAGLTLAQARAEALRILDDANGRRYNADAAYTEIDLKLAIWLSTCLVDYATAGGDRFDLETTGTSSATDGTLSLLSVLPLHIRKVSVVVGASAFAVPGLESGFNGVEDEEARGLQVTYVREYALPTDPTHPLVGVGAAAANSWPAFDSWVCHRAALALGVKDSDERARVMEVKDDLERSVLGRQRTPAGRKFPRPSVSARLAAPDLGWRYIQSTQKLQLIRTGWV